MTYCSFLYLYIYFFFFSPGLCIFFVYHNIYLYDKDFYSISLFQFAYWKTGNPVYTIVQVLQPNSYMNYDTVYTILSHAWSSRTWWNHLLAAGHRRYLGIEPLIAIQLYITTYDRKQVWKNKRSSKTETYKNGLAHKSRRSKKLSFIVCFS